MVSLLLGPAPLTVSICARLVKVVEARVVCLLPGATVLFTELVRVVGVESRIVPVEVIFSLEIAVEILTLAACLLLRISERIVRVVLVERLRAASLIPAVTKATLLILHSRVVRLGFQPIIQLPRLLIFEHIVRVVDLLELFFGCRLVFIVRLLVGMELLC